MHVGILGAGIGLSLALPPKEEESVEDIWRPYSMVIRIYVLYFIYNEVFIQKWAVSLLASRFVY
jgi:hypothetical protein